MKYVEPILFPISPNPLDPLNYAGEHGLKEIDVHVNIWPYKLYYELYYRYVDPDLQQKCLVELSKCVYPVNEISIEDFVLSLKSMIKESGSVYKNYYYLFITKYLMENPQYEQSIDKFFEWLKEPKVYAFKKGFKLNIIENIQSYKYNTIIYLNMWSDKQKNIIPWLNLLMDIRPKFFNQSKIINRSGMYLMNGGRVYVENKRIFGKVWFSLGPEFEVVDDVIVKNSPPKPKTNLKNETNWL